MDMYGSKHHYLVWRGVVSKSLAPTATPDEQERSLNKSVATLLKTYPPSYSLPI